MCTVCVCVDFLQCSHRAFSPFYCVHTRRARSPASLAVHAVNQGFPMNWVWWLTIIVCTVMLWIVSEVLTVKWDMRDIKVNH